MKKLTKIIFAAPIVAPTLSICACGENNDAVYNNLKDSMINYFLDWCKYPHPSYYWGPINKHLTEWANSKGWTVSRDDYYKQEAQANWADEYKDYYGNIWFDVPATAGYESYPTTILQAHMDMVIDGMTIEEAITTPIKPYINNENNTMTSEGKQTSLGADDGAGACMALALITNPKVEHGPIRVVFTADEEVGLFGAAALGKKDDGTQIDVLGDAKYLINIDGDVFGNIVNSSAGIRGFWYKLIEGDQAKVSTIDSSCTKTVTINCSGVRGGHSAGNIIKHASALKCLLDVIDKSGLAVGDNKFQWVSATTNVVVTNAIQKDATIQFATSDANAETKINIAINATLDKWKGLCPDEKDIEITATYGTTSTSTKALTDEFSKTFFSFINWYDFGVLDWLVVDKSPKSSQNIGPLVIDCTQEEITNVLLFGTLTRSCENEYLEKYKADAINWTDTMLGTGHYEVASDYPPFQPKEDNPLRDAMIKGYDFANVKANVFDEHGGLEISQFAIVKPNLFMTSIGLQLTDMHSKNETLYLYSILPTLKALTYTLKILK